ncbi:hypothetical protein GCM10011351_09760 [Paraliobacillus quinghaiensis]|uniref:Uncharacterized protein n=1 Tax=Paraliobacillus quinghaiensis TaxID=470815 RepID=A0A917TJT7_9BACI|nr:hypothetical protein [Paraliobacillus quinghaiensis]GGM26163.1 hypothetical protein GCM10011351_09760 [Paraliobacillus quinghaiensis]
MPIQNEFEIQQLTEVSRKLEDAANHAKNNADLDKMQQLHEELRNVQDKIQGARGKAINGSGTSTEPLFEAQLRVEEAQQQMERAILNLNAQEDNTHY